MGICKPLHINSLIEKTAKLAYFHVSTNFRCLVQEVNYFYGTI